MHEIPQLHSSVVAMVLLASVIAASHPDMGQCQLTRLRHAGVPQLARGGSPIVKQFLRSNEMKTIKVLGTGCANCKRTMALIEDTAKAKGVEVDLEKVEDISAIMGYGVMSTPGVVIDGVVVHAGGVPDRSTVESWMSK